MAKQRRPFKLTRAGWVFILYTIGVGAGAINTGNNLLYLVFGLFLGLLLASGVLSDLSLWGVTVTPQFPDFATTSEVTCLPFRLTNTKKYFSSFSVVFEFDGTLSGQIVSARAHVPLIDAKENVSHLLMVTFPRRGLFRPDKARLSTHYPFGLLKKWWRISLEKTDFPEIFVLPSVQNVDLAAVERHAGGVETQSASHKRGDGSTFHNLRDYQYADHPRTIDWKASAKRTDILSDRPAWMVKEMEKEEQSSLLIELPAPSEVNHLTLPERDRFVEFVYSFYASAKGQGRPVHLTGWTSSAERYYVVDPKRFLSIWDPTVFPDQFVSLEEPSVRSDSRTISALSAFAAHV